MEYDVSKLNELVDSGDIAAIKQFMNEYDLELSGGAIRPKNKEFIEEYEEKASFYDRRQHIRKIQLNSLYGALTNKGSMFFDQRIGQSITLTGRCITRHMGAYINEMLTGSYDYEGETIIYGDTDSIYFSAEPVRKEMEAKGLSFDKETIIQFYDALGEDVNSTFAQFMSDYFNTGLERGAIIEAGREVIGLRGLFVKKKRYAILVYDNEGKRCDVDGKPGKLKVMGMETQRSDTPEYCQKFLKDLLLQTLTEADRDKLIDMTREFRKEFNKMQPWQMGSPKGMNGLTMYTELEDNYRRGKAKDKPRLPGHIRAAYNYNKLREAFKDQYSMAIEDGMKIRVCRLKDNNMDIETIAIPVDETQIPEWLKELPFDKELMESTIIDKKVDNLIGLLGWRISEDSRQMANFGSLFSF